MSIDRGTFSMARGWFDHPLFANEPFTEREAWAWMIAEAAWRPHKRRVGSVVVNLDRGQLSHSLRFMAAKWQWKEPRVRRFLNRLKIDAAIDAGSDAGVSVITICNYERYQGGLSPSDAGSDALNDAAATQQRRKVESNKYNKLNSTEERDIDIARVETFPAKRNDLFSNPDFESWWKQYPRKVDKGPARKLYDRIVSSGQATPSQLMAGVLRYAAERDGEDSQYTKHASTWLNAEGWLNETTPRVAAGQDRFEKSTVKTGPASGIAGIWNQIERLERQDER